MHPPGESAGSPQIKYLLESDVVKVKDVNVMKSDDLYMQIKGMESAFVIIDAQTAPETWVTQELLSKVTKAVIIGEPSSHYLETFRGMHVVRSILLHDDPVGEYIAYYPGAIRLAFSNIDRLSRCGALKDLPERDQQTFARLARAIAEVRVGLALGGGGAWGYAHVALLQELDKIGVPIDVISGVSFGSLAGAFYAADGVRALKTLVDQGRAFEISLIASGLLPLPRLSQKMIDSALGGRRLEFLETPFFPIGLDLNTGEEWSPASGTVGYGVRAASEMPGFCPPLIDVRRGIRSVDGAYINNVPEGVMIREQADFIIAADVVPSPQPTQESWRTRFWSVVSPISRMRDTMRSVGVLMQLGNDRDRDLASKRFLAPSPGISMLAFSKASEIIERTRAHATEFASETLKEYQGSTLLRANRASG